MYSCFNMLYKSTLLRLCLFSLCALFLITAFAQPHANSKTTIQPNEAHLSPEAKQVLATGAKRLDLPEFQTYAVYWFPPDYAKQPQKRTLLVLHGSYGNAYQGIFHQLSAAQENGYGLIALQWWMTGLRSNKPSHKMDDYLRSDLVEKALYKSLSILSTQYPIDSKRLALETFSRSGANSYETVFWNRTLHHPPYQLVIVQSGGIPKDHPTPLIRDLIAGRYGKKPFSGTRFFFYCGEKDREWGPEMCRQIQYAGQVVTQLGATVVKLIDSPQGGHGGLHNIPAYRQAEIESFLNVTR